MLIAGEKDQKYLSSSDGINTYSTGAKTSEHKPSIQLDKMYDNGAFNEATQQTFVQMNNIDELKVGSH